MRRTLVTLILILAAGLACNEGGLASTEASADLAPPIPPHTHFVACGGGGPCDRDADEVCCVDPYSAADEWTCARSCPFAPAERRCDGPEDCEGRPCCGLSAWGAWRAPPGATGRE